MVEQKPVTEVLLDRKDRQTLVEFATTLETIARKLKEKGAFTLTEGEREIFVNPADTLKVESLTRKKAISIPLRLNLIGGQEIRLLRKWVFSSIFV